MKINAVALKGMNEEEIPSLMVWAHGKGMGLTLIEVAAELGVPIGTVKSRLHYATNTLRAALEADLRLPTDTSREHSA